MNRLVTTMTALPGLIAGLLVTFPVCAADTDGVALTFSRGQGLKPAVQTERITPESERQITTDVAEVREVLLADGTSIILSPNSKITIDGSKHSDAGSGHLSLHMDRGLVRIATGTMGESGPVVVRTASAEVSLDAASAVIEVADNGRTRTSMLAGHAVLMTSGGKTQTIERPGFELVSNESRSSPDHPVREADGAAAMDAYALGTAQLAGLTPQGEDDLGRVGIAELADIGASTLALATENKPGGSLASSGQPETPLPAPTTPGVASGFSEVGAIGGGSGSSGFGVGSVLATPSIAGDQPSASNSLSRSVLQSRDPDIRASTDPDATFSRHGSDAIRDAGLTTNRLYSTGFTETIVGSQAPIAVPAIEIGAPGVGTLSSTRLQYVFLETDLFGPGLSPPTSGMALEVPTQPPDNNSAQVWDGDVTSTQGLLGGISGAPFILPRVLGASGTIATAVALPGSNDGSIFGTHNTPNLATTYQVLQAGFTVVPIEDLPDATPEQQLFKTNVLKAAEDFGNVPGFTTTVLRNADNFLLLQAEPTGGDGSTQYLFAAGNVDAGRITPAGTVNNSFINTFSVDKFFISAGLSNFDQKDQGATVGSDIRAFMRQGTSLGLPLNDSGLFVVNAPGAGPVAQNSFIHADFGISGAGSAQQSTISLTVGNGTYSPVVAPPASCSGCPAYEVATISVNESGRTIGSSHGVVSGTQIGTVAINSPLINTSAGGGNPALQRDGYAGYFVFENYTPPSDQGFTAALDGGTEHAIGGAVSSDVNYAALRLATATGEATVGARGSNVLTGWAGGLAEKENGAGAPLSIVPIGTGTEPNNFIIQTDAAANSVQASVLLSGHAPMTLGGPGNPSAMIDDNRFGAANSTVAMVNANLLRDANGNLPATLNLPNGQPIANYQYLQWGFLFGDTAGTAGTDLEHLHLGTWVAGRPADPNQLPTIGSATYSGHAIGNVANGGALYTAVGSYDNVWDFSKRTGTVSVNFDGAQYSGTTQLQNGVVFTGSMSAGDANRTGGVVGNFVQAPGGSPASTPPPAVAGRFVIQQSEGNPYRASGTFGAERAH